MLIVMIGWVFFKSTTISSAEEYVTKMVSFTLRMCHK